MKLLFSVSGVSAAAEKARKLGLVHVGFGRYADPKSKKVTHASRDGKLVKLVAKKSTKAAPKPIPKNAELTHGTYVPKRSFYRVTSDKQLVNMVPTGAQLEKHKDAIVQDTASAAHDAWAADFHKSNGKGAQRIKKTKDAAWIKTNGTDEVDIANTKFKDLPSDWQKENLEGAQAAYDALHKVYGSNKKAGGYAKASDLDKASSHVHDKWLDRNGSWAPEHQKVKFNKLSTEEKDKDRLFVDAALRSYAKKAHSVHIGQ